MKRWKKAQESAEQLCSSDPSAAIEAYTTAIEKAPERERTALLEGRAAVLDRLQRPDDATRDRDAILAQLETLEPPAEWLPTKDNRRRAEQFELRARTYERLGRTDEARRDWQSAVTFLDTALATTPNEGEPLEKDWMVHASGENFPFIPEAEKTRSPEARNRTWGNGAVRDAALGHPDLLLRRADARRGLGDQSGAREDLDHARELLDRAIAESTDPQLVLRQEKYEIETGQRPQALAFDLKLRAEISEHAGEETAAVRDRLGAAAVLELGFEEFANLAKTRAGELPWWASDRKLSAAAGTEHFARQQAKGAHATANEERRVLIEQGRAVALGSCRECGVVQLTDYTPAGASGVGVDAAGHRTAVTQVVARDDVDEALVQLGGAPVGPGTPAAWYPDPTARHQHRYWDGAQWTDHVADQGVQADDRIDAGS